jgi:predicted secreted acid phosphatase
VADAVDDENDNERQTVPEYVYDWFFNKYGLRKLAEQQLAKMFATVLRFGKKLVDPDNQLEDGRQISRNAAMEKNEDALYLFMFGR